MRNALRFLASTTAEERNEAYGSWAVPVVVAAFVLAVIIGTNAFGTGLSSLRDGAPAGLHPSGFNRLSQEIPNE